MHLLIVRKQSHNEVYNIIIAEKKMILDLLENHYKLTTSQIDDCCRGENIANKRRSYKINEIRIDIDSMLQELTRIHNLLKGKHADATDDTVIMLKSSLKSIDRTLENLLGITESTQ